MKVDKTESRISLTTKDDFENHMNNSLSVNYVTGTPNTNQWTFNIARKSVHIKVGNTFSGSFRKKITNVSAGDIIRFSMDVYNVSGVKAKIECDGFEVTSKKQGQWETLTLDIIVTAAMAARTEPAPLIVYFGVWTGDIGEFKARDVSIVVESVNYNSRVIIAKGRDKARSFNLYSDGTLECFGTFEADIASNVSWDSWYGYRVSDGLQKFAVEFEERPLFFYGASNGKTGFVAAYHSDKRTEEEKRAYIPAIEVYRPTDDGRLKLSVDYRAIGTAAHYADFIQ